MNKFFERIVSSTARVEGTGFICLTRPYGRSVVLDSNTRIHEMLNEPSAHFHRFRTEEYILYSGKMTVYRGPVVPDYPEVSVALLEPTELKPGDRVVIPPFTVHLPINTEEEPAVFIEVSHGPYEETDIVRVYDKLGRDEDLRNTWQKLGYEAGIGVADLIQATRKKWARLSWVRTRAQVKRVAKPWGNLAVDGVDGVGELWLTFRQEEEGTQAEAEKMRYIMKELHIKRGTRASLQHHVAKSETNHLVAGVAEAFMDNEQGVMERSIFVAGDSWPVIPGRKHRLHALTDLVMDEASTWEIDDVVRHKDDTGRGSGRIQGEHEQGR